MDSLRVLPPDFFAELQADESVELAILLKRNGRMLASWSRSPVTWEIATIMAATTLGSLETMMESLQAASPETVTVRASGLRLVFEKVESQSVLVLAAKEAVPEVHLRDMARRLISKLPPPSGSEASRKMAPGPHAR